uniref:Uncharacterized protein n=1 Tax=Solanum lycopersicum TaxID=4081 RepID=A0A3Q7GEF5_SOLLC
MSIKRDKLSLRARLKVPRSGPFCVLAAASTMTVKPRHTTPHHISLVNSWHKLTGGIIRTEYW